MRSSSLGHRVTMSLCTCTAAAGLTTFAAARHPLHSCMQSVTIPDRSSSVRRRWTTLKDSSRRRFCRDCVGGWPPTSCSSCVSAPASRRSRAVCRPDIDLHLDHDTALQLTPEDALNGRAQATRYALLALRQDNEAPAGLSWGQFDGVRLDPAYYGRSFDHWVRIHALASRIITNRTHSSILGAVLRKPTTLLGGSYHKNRSIWEYSLAPRGVRWLDWNMDAANHKPVTNPWQQMPLIGRVARSWKVERALKRLQGVPWS